MKFLIATFFAASIYLNAGTTLAVDCFPNSQDKVRPQGSQYCYGNLGTSNFRFYILGIQRFVDLSSLKYGEECNSDVTIKEEKSIRIENSDGKSKLGIGYYPDQELSVDKFHSRLTFFRNTDLTQPDKLISVLTMGYDLRYPISIETEIKNESLSLVCY